MLLIFGKLVVSARRKASVGVVPPAVRLQHPANIALARCARANLQDWTPIMFPDSISHPTNLAFAMNHHAVVWGLAPFWLATRRTLPSGAAAASPEEGFRAERTASRTARRRTERREVISNNPPKNMLTEEHADRMTHKIKGRFRPSKNRQVFVSSKLDDLVVNWTSREDKLLHD